jgi:radical SAM superfamily enzyme YgiQ (UPF0313 family)
MRYQGVVIRPPSEANSFILQITYGCAHNKCTFCGTYLNESFKVRPIKDVLTDIKEAATYEPETRRVFLCDGDAMILPNNKLIVILDALKQSFPELQRVGIYANARNILTKTEDELKELAAHKLTIGYMGLESGNPEILKRVKKGATREDMIEAVRKAQKCGIKMSVIAILGIAGRELSKQHAMDTASAVSQMNPRYFSLLTLMLVPGTELCNDYEAGRFELPTPKEFLEELRLVIDGIDSPNTIFRTNHASNYAPLEGTFNKDKARILKELDTYLAGEHHLRPEFLRGL